MLARQATVNLQSFPERILYCLIDLCFELLDFPLLRVLDSLRPDQKAMRDRSDYVSRDGFVSHAIASASGIRECVVIPLEDALYDVNLNGALCSEPTSVTATAAVLTSLMPFRAVDGIESRQLGKASLNVLFACTETTQASFIRLISNRSS